jgi:hypothetical protein
MGILSRVASASLLVVTAACDLGDGVYAEMPARGIYEVELIDTSGACESALDGESGRFDVETNEETRSVVAHWPEPPLELGTSSATGWRSDWVWLEDDPQNSYRYSPEPCEGDVLIERSVVVIDAETFDAVLSVSFAELSCPESVGIGSCEGQRTTRHTLEEACAEPCALDYDLDDGPSCSCDG